jgi:TRAP-type C4-dicarboxylate transport system permease small subunit
MDRLRIARNVAIIALIAAAVEFLPGGGRVADAFAAALWVVFAVGFAFLGYRLYRERGIDLHSLGDRHRALLYGAIAVGFATIAARSRMWHTTFGEFLWFALIGLAAYTLLAVYRYSRTY